MIVNKSLAVATFQVFLPEQVRKINEKIKKSASQPQNLSDAARNVTKIGKFFDIPCEPLMELIHPWLYKCQQSNNTYFGYDIDWEFHLDALTYNVYGTDGEYGWHIDASDKRGTVNDSKLTCLLNLSEEPYEGCKFYVINSVEEQKFTSGMGIVFTSLIAHKVTPITKGERITLTYWASGPSWR